MPPSFVFLVTLARYISSGGKLWFVPAGIKRASVSDATAAEYIIGGTTLDKWQNNNPQYINPIMPIRSYGFVIFGQRTLYKNVEGATSKRSALQELGVRITANEIKRYIKSICTLLTFDGNNVHTWNEFNGQLDPLLSQMKADGGINDYQILMDSNTTSAQNIADNVIHGIVRISVARAAEDFEIDFELNDSSVVYIEEA
jgi:phage tail sheath protein FI